MSELEIIRFDCFRVSKEEEETENALILEQYNKLESERALSPYRHEERKIKSGVRVLNLKHLFWQLEKGDVFYPFETWRKYCEEHIYEHVFERKDKPDQPYPILHYRGPPGAVHDPTYYFFSTLFFTEDNKLVHLGSKNYTNKLELQVCEQKESGEEKDIPFVLVSLSLDPDRQHFPPEILEMLQVEAYARFRKEISFYKQFIIKPSQSQGKSIITNDNVGQLRNDLFSIMEKIHKDEVYQTPRKFLFFSDSVTLSYMITASYKPNLYDFYSWIDCCTSCGYTFVQFISEQ